MEDDQLQAVARQRHDGLGKFGMGFKIAAERHPDAGVVVLRGRFVS